MTIDIDRITQQNLDLFVLLMTGETEAAVNLYGDIAEEHGTKGHAIFCHSQVQILKRLLEQRGVDTTTATVEATDGGTIDNAEPTERTAVRLVLAGLNGDSETFFDLYDATFDAEDEGFSAMKVGWELVKVVAGQAKEMIDSGMPLS